MIRDIINNRIRELQLKQGKAQEEGRVMDALVLGAVLSELIRLRDKAPGRFAPNYSG